MENIELRPAYAWDCPNCGREVFCRAMVLEMADEDQRQIREDFFGDPDDKGFFMSVPKKVKCGWCNTEYGVELYNCPEMDDGDIS